jgi:signal peptidase I
MTMNPGDPEDVLPGAELLPAPQGDSSQPPGARGSVHERLAEEIVPWFKTLASAGVYATLIVTFGFQVARVEGHSMAPTLHDQDRLVVNKFAYLTYVGEPKVGDVVMLYSPSNPDQALVKRVMAAEGQWVRVVNGRLFVDDQPVNDDFVADAYRGHDDYGPVRIREGFYFVMGDHRNASSDSRSWGDVPRKYIIGRVQVRWWPLSDARIF